MSICLLAACLVGSVGSATACFGGSGASESSTSSESLEEAPGSSDSESSEVAEKYTVAFVDYDDSVISTAEYEVGAAVVVPETPVRAADETYTYEFAGWDSEVVAVAGNVTYKATFREIYIDYIVKFLNADDSEISTATYHYGDEVAEPEAPAQTATKVYSFVFDGWDKEIVNVVGDAIYTAKYVATVNAGYKVNEGSAGENGSIVLNQSSIGEGASIETGTINGGSIDQSYLALDGNYALNDYVAFDFTGKNMPEVAFFAKNYNKSMYAEGTSKQGIVVVTGITQWDGSTSWVNGNNTQINYGFPYMIQDTKDSGFVDGAFANSALGRANLVDGTHYRVIMGFTGSGSAITLNWCLYNLDTNAVLEQSSMSTWGFFDGGNAQVGNMTINDLSGSIVLYGKFGATLTIDKLYGIYENTDINTLVEGLNSEKTYTVTFNDANGNELKKVENLSFGSTVSYDETLPTPDKAEDSLFTYSYVWDREIGPV